MILVNDLSWIYFGHESVEWVGFCTNTKKKKDIFLMDLFVHVGTTSYFCSGLWDLDRVYVCIFTYVIGSWSMLSTLLICPKIFS